MANKRVKSARSVLWSKRKCPSCGKLVAKHSKSASVACLKKAERKAYGKGC